jgi:hypothetical protein
MDGEKSKAVEIRTMDTTIHNIEWTVTEIARVGGTSWMDDVSIVDENDIWAVGTFYPDNSGQPWAVAHWDGISWKYSKAWYSNIPRLPKDCQRLKTVWTFDKNNVYAACGSTLLKWNGDTTWNIVAFLWDFEATTDGAPVTKLWASSENDIYIAAQKGYIYHYTGNGKFVKLKANTNLDISDIYGDINPKTGKYEIYANAINPQTYQRALLEVTDSKTDLVELKPQVNYASSLWFKSNKKYYLAGSSIYSTHDIHKNDWQDIVGDVSDIRIERVRGNDVNDIFGVGSYNEILHYNGLNWKTYRDEFNDRYKFYSVTVKNNIVVAVGLSFITDKAVIVLGKRK